MERLNAKTIVATVLISFVVGYGGWVCARALLSGGRSVTIYGDEVSAARGTQERGEHFRERCASVGFTADQCAFFQRGADAP
jgi:hypothetical protein